MKHRNILSLKEWLFIFTIVVLVVAIFRYMGNSNLAETTTIETPITFFNPERLNTSRNNQIVLIGTSLVRCGIPFDKALNENLAKKNSSFRITRMTHNGRDARPFKSILSEIVKAKPNIVILQDTYLIDYKEIEKDEKIFLAGYRQYIYNVKSYLFGNGAQISWENYGQTTKSCTYQDKRYSNPHSQQKLLLKQYTLWDHRLKQNNSISFFYDFIAELKSNGTTVIFIEMGRSKVANDFLGKEKLAQVERSLQQLSEKTGSIYWRFPGNLPLDHYTDFSHLNAKGQRVATSWFIDRLSQYESSR
jgi:hypothetical protein